VAILALGVWMKYKLFVYVQLTTIYYDAAPYILIAVGCAIIIVGSLGCLCTFKGLPALLYIVSHLPHHRLIFSFLPPDAVRWRCICHGDVAVCLSVCVCDCHVDVL